MFVENSKRCDMELKPIEYCVRDPERALTLCEAIERVVRTHTRAAASFGLKGRTSIEEESRPGKIDYSLYGEAKDGEIIANWSVSVRCKGEKDAFSLSVTPLGPCPKNLYAQIAEMVPKTPEAVYAPHPVISEEID